MIDDRGAPAFDVHVVARNVARREGLDREAQRATHPALVAQPVAPAVEVWPATDDRDHLRQVALGLDDPVDLRHEGRGRDDAGDLLVGQRWRAGGLVGHRVPGWRAGERAGAAGRGPSRLELLSVGAAPGAEAGPEGPRGLARFLASELTLASDRVGPSDLSHRLHVRTRHPQELAGHRDEGRKEADRRRLLWLAGAKVGRGIAKKDKATG